MKSLFKKILALGIIFLFIEISVIPISADIVNKNSLTKNLKVINEDRIFDHKINTLIKLGHFPSLSVCIIKNNSVVFAKGYGLRDRENNSKATENTVYLLASITKSITATALLQLYENKSYNFDLDDNVNDKLPFNLSNPNFLDKPITYRMLLSHSASLRHPSNYGFDLTGAPPLPGYPMPWLQDMLLPNGSRYSPEIWSETYGPGEKTYYSNISYDILGYLVEQISGKPLYEYCEEHIFKPLEMYNTSWDLSDYTEDQLAIPYRYQILRYKGGENYVPFNYPVGGLRSTVMDLSHFLIAHMNGGVYNGTRILKNDTVEEMHEIQPPGNSYGYFKCGLGWTIARRNFRISIIPFSNVHGRNLYGGHGGDAVFGFHTKMYIKLSDDTGVIFFVNGERLFARSHNIASLLLELFFLKADRL